MFTKKKVYRKIQTTNFQEKEAELWKGEIKSLTLLFNNGLYLDNKGQFENVPISCNKQHNYNICFRMAFEVQLIYIKLCMKHHLGLCQIKCTSAGSSSHLVWLFEVQYE